MPFAKGAKATPIYFRARSGALGFCSHQQTNNLKPPSMNRLFSISVLSTAAVLTGCATPISQEAFASADYGPSPTEKHQQVIRAKFDKMLIDPTSPLYEFEAPRKGYTKASPMFGTRQAFGWQVCGTINSKNRFGGYAGRVPFFVLMRGDEIREFIYGANGSNVQLTNIAIEQACGR